jgi:hypothetical protein
MTAIKYVMPKDAAELAKLCDKAVKSVQTARVNVQQAAVGVLYHAFKHGDYSAATSLVTSLGNTINGKALVEFFVKFGGLSIDEEKGAFVDWKGKDYIEKAFNDAKATMWWDLKLQQPFKGFDLEAALQNVLKKHKETQEKVKGMTPEDQAKVNMHVNEATMQQLFAICNFEAIVSQEEQEAADKAA